jgi:hypothetical protein
MTISVDTHIFWEGIGVVLAFYLIITGIMLIAMKDDDRNVWVPIACINILFGLTGIIVDGGFMLDKANIVNVNW